MFSSALRMHRTTQKNFLKLAFLTLLFSTVIFFAKNLPAGFNNAGSEVRVEIDGASFGSFDKITDINALPQMKDANGDSFIKVTLNRDFVTEPSLYLWARNQVNLHQGLKDIHLVKLNRDGNEIERHVLRLCQPLSWTVEASNPALGGYHETVELAVQEISTL